jgi:hypothetical protein
MNFRVACHGSGERKDIGMHLADLEDIAPGGQALRNLHRLFTAATLPSPGRFHSAVPMADESRHRKRLAFLPPPCPRDCPSARLAALKPVAERGFKASPWSLIALLVPAAGMGLALWLARDRPGYEWLAAGRWPWQLWLLALAGGAATAAGLGDWLYHRVMTRCAISRGERRCELLALAAGGIPVFVMMLAASVSARPLQWLLPVMAGVIFTTALICYDEFIFHRKRCQKLETRLHRVLVFGNGAAWMAWAHWCFVERAAAVA